MGPHKPPKIKVKPPKPRINVSGKGTKPSWIPYYDGTHLYNEVGLYYTSVAGTFPSGQIPKINVGENKSKISSAKSKNAKMNVYKPKISIKKII
jgi:hypothetical protein